MIDAKSIISKYYTKLSVIPATLGRSIALVMVLLLLLLIPSLISQDFIYAFQTILVVSALFVLSLSIPTFNVKRSSNLLFFSLLPMVFIEIPLTFCRIPGLSFTLVPIVYMLVVKGISRTCRVPLYVIVVLAIFELSISITHSEPYTMLFYRIFMLVTSTILASFVINRISSIGRKHGYDILKIANAWAQTMLLQDPTELENLFAKMGAEHNARVHIYLFQRENSSSIAFVIPHVHFGPFRNVGSSALIYMIEDELSKQGLEALVFHGAGSHELNIVSRNDSRLFAELIAKMLRLSRPIPSTAFKPFRVVEGFKEAFVIPFQKSVLVLISNSVVGGDDLPKELQHLADEVGKVYGYEWTAIVDCHNMEGKRDLDISKYIALLKKALSIRTNECKEFKIGIGIDRVSGITTGLCKDIVKAIAISCDGRKYALVYLYGNNAAPNVRDSVRRSLIENLRLDDVELLTADDHTCSATSFDTPYQAVHLSNTLMKSIVAAVSKALDDLMPTKVYELAFIIKTRVVGEKIYSLLSIVEEAGSTIKKWFLLSILALYTLSFLAIVVRGIHLI